MSKLCIHVMYYIVFCFYYRVLLFNKITIVLWLLNKLYKYRTCMIIISLSVPTAQCSVATRHTETRPIDIIDE